MTASKVERTFLKPFKEAMMMQPVIIGSGLSGMTISRTLTKASIPHILIGSAPNSLPRLGESLNLEGTLGLLELFPELSRYCYRKKFAVGYMGDYVVSCNFFISNSVISRYFFKMLGYSAPEVFLQFDRLGFDAELFKSTVSSNYCTQIDAKVENIDHDSGTDAIKTIYLSDRTTLNPSYVFDATNHGRVVGKAANIVCNMIGDLQRVVYTHYRMPSGLKEQDIFVREWQYATSIVFLYHEIDQIDAIAWCIPLGDYVSIGVSMKDKSNELSDEEILKIAENAFYRRGLVYRDLYPNPTTIIDIKHRYFIHERAYGSNWLLVGPAYCQAWWMAGAGVGTALSAAQIAAKVLYEPVKYGMMYQNYLKDLMNIHETFNWFALTEYQNVTPEGISKYSDRFVITNLKRLVKSNNLRNNRIGLAIGSIFSYLSNKIIKNYCQVYQSELINQTAYALADPSVNQGDKLWKSKTKQSLRI